MIDIDTSFISCGVAEMFNLPDRSREGRLANALDGLPLVEPFILFSDATNIGNGAAMARLIRKHRLGTVRTSAIRRNPNSGNRIRVWIWEPDRKRVRAFVEKYRDYSLESCGEEIDW